MWDAMIASLTIAWEAAMASVVGLEWIVIDAGLWYDPRRAIDLAGKIKDHGGRFPVTHAAPKPTFFHGPWVDSHLPDQNGARNTGIIYANGDYLVFLDDCSVVHHNFFKRVLTAREAGRIVCFDHRYYGNFPHTGFPHHDLRPAEDERKTSYYLLSPTSLRGSGVGYPLEILLDLNGFNEAHSGAPKEDLEIGLRLETAGYKVWGDRSTLIVEAINQEPLFEDVLPAPNESRLDRLLSSGVEARSTRLARQLDLRLARERVRAWRRKQG